MRLAAVAAAGDEAVVRCCTDLATRTAIGGIGVQLDAGIGARRVSRRTTHVTALRAAFGRAVDGRRASHAAFPAVLRVGAQADTRARAIFLACWALRQADPFRARLSVSANMVTKPAIARVLL